MTSRSIPLENGYTAEFDAVDAQGWYEITDRFNDSNIYQMWAYDAVRCGEQNLSHFVLRQSGKIVAAAQCRIARLPVPGLGAAYIRWGPIWQQDNRKPNPAAFQMAIRALRNEYVCRRGLILRIFPILYGNDTSFLNDITLSEKYVHTPKETPQRTLILDIQPALEDIRKNFKQKWRNCLNRSEKNGLSIIEGTDDGMFADFIGLYRELLDRKKFKEPNDINEFRTIQHVLPDKFKMGIFLCQTAGESSAGAVCTAIGDTGVYIFGATNRQGMKNKGSYLIQWKAIQWMKENGCRYYNLNGINPETNPGGYHFKAGVSGKSGKDVTYLGRFDCYPGAVKASFARVADSLLPSIKNILSRSKK